MNHNDAGRIDLISTHAPAGGATRFRPNGNGCRKLFLLTPLREGRRPRPSAPPACSVFLLTPLREGRRNEENDPYCADRNFYSRPCGRGDLVPRNQNKNQSNAISTHAPAGGATNRTRASVWPSTFLLTPLREGLPCTTVFKLFYITGNFFSRPCGRGDKQYPRQRLAVNISTHAPAGGATDGRPQSAARQPISTHAPAGGATTLDGDAIPRMLLFLLTPLREGRPIPV